MYWQVYLHKTTLAAEHMLIAIIKRARELAKGGQSLSGTEPLLDFLTNDYTKEDFVKDPTLLDKFSSLDDFDVLAAVKSWTNHPDKILSYLCKCLINRDLFKIKIEKEPISEDIINQRVLAMASRFGVSPEQASYLVLTGKVWNSAYKVTENNINILFKDGRITDIAQASDNLNISSLASPVIKYFVATPA
jgi:HD superfamily phosphohydrolase